MVYDYNTLYAQRKPIEILPATTDRINLFASNLKKALLEFRSGKIVIFADYDCDGIFSALEMQSLVKIYCQNEVKVVISDRHNDGYGIRRNALDYVDNGDIVIILDMGAQEHKIISKLAVKSGRAPFIVDHHEMSDVMINYPHHACLNFYDGSMSGIEPAWCTAGLVYKIFTDITENTQIPSVLRNTVAAYAAIATIADMVPVNTGYDDNAVIIMLGLSIMSDLSYNKIDPTLEFVLTEAKVANVPHVTTRSVAFNVIPVVNAMSRIVDDGGQEAFNTLSKPKDINAVNRMFENNLKRKDLVERHTTDSAEYQEFLAKTNRENTKVVIYIAKDMPPGIVGLLAAKLKNEFKVPTMCAVQLPDGSYTASCRNADGYPDALEIFSRCVIPGVHVGGHANAFGVHIDDTECLKGYCYKLRSAYENVIPTKIEENYLNTTGLSVHKLYSLEPFGVDYPNPDVNITGPLTDIKVFKGKWLSAKVNGIKVFGTVPTDLNNYNTVNIKGSLDINAYRGRFGVSEDLQVSIDTMTAV